jgi:hypothetical protein
MNLTTKAAILGLALALPNLDTHANSHATENLDSHEVVIEWNELLEQLVPRVGLLPPGNYATLHVAMFDAVNSIERMYSPYRVQVHAAPGASAEIAAAQAAHDVLVALFPAEQAKFDSALRARIGASSPAQARTAIEVGQAAAKAVLAWRQDDGWNATPPTYLPTELPGHYRLTPPTFSPPAFRQFAQVKPFALISSTQYLPPPPAPLASEQYAKDFDEVKQLGSLTSSLRTEEQTQLAHLFAAVTTRTLHWAIWNHVARDTARARKLSLIDAARVFALLNVSIHDGVQTSHTSKFVYWGWRPVTAIHHADDDLNPRTTGDPAWQPLLTTPPYPSHGGNMACVSASAARILGLIYGSDEARFTAHWLGANGQPDVSRNYTRFTQLAQDQANSRIYGGIHFRYESLASQASCPKVAEYVFANYLRPSQEAALTRAVSSVRP